VGAERARERTCASRRSNLFVQRSGTSDANGYSSRRRSQAQSTSLLRYSLCWPMFSTLHNHASPFSLVFSPLWRLFSITNYEASDYIGGGDTRVLWSRRRRLSDSSCLFRRVKGFDLTTLARLSRIVNFYELCLTVSISRTFFSWMDRMNETEPTFLFICKTGYLRKYERQY